MKDYTSNLTMVDKLILLALDDEKGTLVSDSMTFGYCIAGAILFELSAKGKIHIEDEKVRVVDGEPLGEMALDISLEMIVHSKKEKSVKHWVEVIGNKGSTLRKKTIEKLISIEVLEEREKKLLWVFTLRQYPSKNDFPENTLRARLRDIVVDGEDPNVDEIMIISLVDSCGLNKEVYGKVVAKEKDDRIKKLIKEFQFADETGKVIKDIYETIIAVLIVLMATTTTVTAS